jgi:hypothetical protein
MSRMRCYALIVGVFYSDAGRTTDPDVQAVGAENAIQSCDQGLRNWLHSQQCGKSRAIAWEVAPNRAQSDQVSQVMSVAHRTKGFRQNSPASVDKNSFRQLDLVQNWLARWPNGAGGRDPRPQPLTNSRSGSPIFHTGHASPAPGTGYGRMHLHQGISTIFPAI